MGDLATERVVRDVGAIGQDRREFPVVVGSWVMLRREDPVVLYGAVRSEQPDVECVRCLGVEDRRRLPDSTVLGKSATPRRWGHIRRARSAWRGMRTPIPL